MESDRKLKLAELRQKRLAYYSNQAHQQIIEKFKKDEEINIERSEKDRRTNTKEKLNTGSDIKHSSREINVGHLTQSHVSTVTDFTYQIDFDEGLQRQPKNINHLLYTDQEQLISRYFDEPDERTRREYFAPSRSNESCGDENWFESVSEVKDSVDDIRCNVVISTEPCMIDKPLHRSRNYMTVNNVFSEHHVQSAKQDNSKSRESLDDYGLSPHAITTTRKQKKRDKRKKYQRNADDQYQSRTGKQNVERKPASPSLPENFFDLDSLQNAARNGDDVLRKYIQELSTKMVDSQTGIKLHATDHTSERDYDFIPHENHLKQDTYSTNSFASEREAHSRQDLSDSPPDEGNWFLQHGRETRNRLNPKQNSTKLQDFGFQYRDHESIQNKQSASSEFEDQKSKYVPKISRPAIESSQLQKWGLYDDLRSGLSLHGSREEDDALNQFLGSKDHYEKDFDLLTHRPSNRPISPLVQPTSYGEIYEMRHESIPNPLSYDGLHLVTHRPTGNTENKQVERVDEFYKNESSGKSSKPDLHSSIDGDPNIDAGEWFKTYEENIRPTSPEQHMLAVKKYHKIEKQRRKSKNQRNGDSIEHLSLASKYDELSGAGIKKSGQTTGEQETKCRRSSGWQSDQKDEMKTKKGSQGDLLAARRDVQLCMSSDDHTQPMTNTAALTLAPTPTMEPTPSMPEPEIELNEIDGDNFLETFFRNQEFISHDASQTNQDVIKSKQNFDSPSATNTQKTYNFYNKQLISIPPSRSPEPRIPTDPCNPKPSQVLTVDENPDVKFEDVLLGGKKNHEGASLDPSSNAAHEERNQFSMKLDLSYTEDKDDNHQHETYRVKTPLLKKILENENKVGLNLEVSDDKNLRSISPVNSRRKTANRLLDRGTTQKQRWLTSTSLSSSISASRKPSQLSLKDSKRNSTGSSLRLSGKDVGVSKELSRSQGTLQDRSSPGEKWQRSQQKKVANGSFFSVRPAKTAETNGTNSHFQQDIFPPLTLQLLSDSPRGGEGLSIWQLLPDELLVHIFSYLCPSCLAVTAQVCKTFHRIANDELLWKSITLQKKELTDDWLMQIGEKHPTKISFLQCNGKKVSEDGLRAMFRACSKSLKELNVSGSTGGDLIGDSILLHTSRCQGLTSLDVSWCCVSNNGLISVAESIQMLQVLCLNGCQAVTDDSINMILQKHCKSIIVLELFGCFNISPAVISQIGRFCKSLQTLNVGQCYKMTDEYMSTMVSHLEHIQHLDMRGCKQIHDTTVRRLVRCCKKLKSVSLANCGHLTDASLVEISTYLPTIRILDVSGCKKITNQGVHPLAKSCYQLSSLDLSSTSVNYKSVSSLSSYCGKSLQTLKLNFCKDVTEKSVLKLLQHCKRLEKLQLYGVKGLRNLASINSQFPCLKLD